MKTLCRISLLVTSFVIAASPFIRAQTAPAAPAAPSAPATAAAPAAPAGKAKHAHAKRAAGRHHVAKALGLSADQKATLKADHAKTASAIRSIRTDSSLTRDQQREKLHAARQSARAEMRGVLTPDQQQKLDTMKARAHQHHGKGQHAGKKKNV